MEGKTDPTALFRERFSGHEVPAPDGAWEAISSQLTLHAATSTDGVNELFRDRFAQHEAPVDPGAWTAIESQLGGAAGAGAGAGWTAVAGWAAAGVAVLVLTAGVVYLNEKPAPAEAVIATTEQRPGAEVPQGPSTFPTERTTTPDAAPLHDVHAAPRTAAPAPATARPQVRMATAAMEPAADAAQPRANPSDNPPATDASGTNLDPATTNPALPELVIDEMMDVADHKVLQPATVPDTALDDDKPVMAPPVFGSEPEAERFHIFLPNVFTPYNHDGINDEYLPQGEGIGSAIIRVYSVADNRLVFSSNELTPWDGRDMNTGEYCNEGHYLYALEVTGTDGQVRTQGQVVLLMR